MKKKIDIKRFDGRDWDEIRPMYAKINIIPEATGSAIFGFGNTKAIASVFGPKKCKNIEDDEAKINVKYNMLPISIPDKKKHPVTRREMEISEILERALYPNIFLDEYPNTIIDIYVDIINADAGTRTAAFNAIILALLDAGIYMRDIPVAVAVGKIGKKIVIDLNKEEEDYDYNKIIKDPNKKIYAEYYGEGTATDIPVFIYPRYKKFSIIQLDGEISKKELIKAMELALEKSYEIQNFMKNIILNTYKKEFSEDMYF